MIFMSDRPVVNCGGVTPFKKFLQEQIKKTLSTGSDQNSWNVKKGDYNEQVKD